MRCALLSLCFMATLALPTQAFSQSFVSQYKGSPFHDSRYQGGPQKIPGRYFALTTTSGARGSRITTPIQRIMAAES